MRCLPTDLPKENWTKSVGKNFIDGIINGHDPSVRNESAIKKMNITDGKSPYNKNSIGNNNVRNRH